MSTYSEIYSRMLSQFSPHRAENFIIVSYSIVTRASMAPFRSMFLAKHEPVDCDASTKSSAVIHSVCVHVDWLDAFRWRICHVSLNVLVPCMKVVRLSCEEELFCLSFVQDFVLCCWHWPVLVHPQDFLHTHSIITNSSWPHAFLLPHPLALAPVWLLLSRQSIKQHLLRNQSSSHHRLYTKYVRIISL